MFAQLVGVFLTVMHYIIPTLTCRFWRASRLCSRVCNPFCQVSIIAWNAFVTMMPLLLLNDLWSSLMLRLSLVNHLSFVISGNIIAIVWYLQHTELICDYLHFLSGHFAYRFRFCRPCHYLPLHFRFSDLLHVASALWFLVFGIYRHFFCLYLGDAWSVHCPRVNGRTSHLLVNA